jgi:hypothetical protein
MVAGARFTLGSFLARFAFALLVAGATYNPTRYSYYAWAKSTGFEWRPPTVFVGVILLIGWVVCLRLTLRSIGGLGLLLANAFLAAFFWLVASWGWLPIENVARSRGSACSVSPPSWRSACRGRTGAGRGPAPLADQHRPVTSPLGHRGLACVLDLLSHLGL